MNIFECSGGYKRNKWPYALVFIICGSVAESVECALLVRRVRGSNPDDDFVNGDESHAGLLSLVGILMPRVLTTFLLQFK